MALTDNKITTWTNPIVNEADRPQRSAADMKAIFDSNSNQLKKALNGLIDALGQSGGGDIGASVEGMAGNNVQALIAELKGLIDAIEEYTDGLKTPSGAANVGAEVSGITGDNIAAVLTALKTLCDRVDTTGDGDLFLKNDGTYGLPTVGSAANGLPIGGKAGQFLKKASSVNFAGYWGGIVDEALSGLLKASNGELAAAEADVDYQPPIPAGTYATPPASATVLPDSGTPLTANTIYAVAVAVGTYAFTPPATGWAHGMFTTGSSVSVSFAGTFLGAAPSIEASKTYEFDVLDGVWAVQEVVSE